MGLGADGGELYSLAGSGETLYLGTLAMVANTESIGVMLAWREYTAAALDSQGVIQRI